MIATNTGRESNLAPPKSISNASQSNSYRGVPLCAVKHGDIPKGLRYLNFAIFESVLKSVLLVWGETQMVEHGRGGVTGTVSLEMQTNGQKDGAICYRTSLLHRCRLWTI
jgi:hypothetical protein